MSKQAPEGACCIIRKAGRLAAAAIVAAEAGEKQNTDNPFTTAVVSGAEDAIASAAVASTAAACK